MRIRWLRWKRWRLASERENFLLPLFEPLAARSRGLIVHSRAAEAEVRRRLAHAPVARMPSIRLVPVPPSWQSGISTATASPISPW